MGRQFTWDGPPGQGGGWSKVPGETKSLDDPRQGPHDETGSPRSTRGRGRRLDQPAQKTPGATAPGAAFWLQGRRVCSAAIWRSGSGRIGRPCAGTCSHGEPDGFSRCARGRNRARRSDRSRGVRECPGRRRNHFPLRGEGWRLGNVARVSDGLPGRDAKRSPGLPCERASAAFFISARPARMATLRRAVRPIDETAALGENVWILDYYTRSKVECERLLWRMAEREGLPLTVIRPSWLFGERDRTTAPRLIREFRRGRMLIVGKGDNPLSAVYAGVVAEAAILAARDRGLARRGVQHHQPGPHQPARISRLVCRCPRLSAGDPARAVHAGVCGRVLARSSREVAASRRNRRESHATGRGCWDVISSTARRKLRTRLGWKPAIGYAESIERTVRWFLEQP